MSATEMTHRYGMHGHAPHLRCRWLQLGPARSRFLRVSSCERDKSGGGWVRAAAAGVRTFPLARHVSPGHYFKERVYDSDTSGQGVSRQY